MSALSDLEQAYKRAASARFDAQDASRTFVQKLTEEFNTRLARELEAGGYNERVLAARIAEHEARKTLEAEKERIALSETVHPYPLGTRMVEWKYWTHHYHNRPENRALTGRVGILEVITSTSEHPANKTYGLANRGDLVIRILKKDGTPSKMYEQVRRHCAYHWVPEGTDLLQEDLSWPDPDEAKVNELKTESDE